MSDPVLMKVAHALPHHEWYRLGIKYLGLTPVQLDNCDPNAPSFFRTVYSVLHKWTIFQKGKETEVAQTQAQTKPQCGSSNQVDEVPGPTTAGITNTSFVTDLAF